MYKIYILHSGKVAVSDAEKEIFSRIDCVTESLTCACEDDIINMAGDADAVLVHGANITKRVLESLKNLKVAVRCGVGYDNIDVLAANELGITVCNVPDYGTREVASHAMALILCCYRKLTLLNESVKSGKWDYTVSVPIKRASELTIGFAAFGRIAQQVSLMAAPFGFKMLGCDSNISRDIFSKRGVANVSFEEMLEQSDIVTCHVPMSEDNKHMFDETAFSKMKKGVIFVNTSRGGVIDEGALIRALEKGTVSFAGLDVFETEPLPEENPLRRLQNVILTPHAAWYSEEAAMELKTKSAEEAVRVLNGEAPLNPVTK